MDAAPAIKLNEKRKKYTGAIQVFCEVFLLFLEATPHQTAVILPLNYNRIKYPSKTSKACGTLLRK